MPLSRKLALTPDQIDEIMTTEWNCRIATCGPGDRINLTPMWFGWAGGRVYIFGRGQKVVNLRRNPSCTVIVDRNEKFPELQAVMVQGQAHVLEDARAEQADPHLQATTPAVAVCRTSPSTCATAGNDAGPDTAAASDSISPHSSCTPLVGTPGVTQGPSPAAVLRAHEKK